MIQTDEVELFELFQTIIVGHARPTRVDPAADPSSYFSRAPDALNRHPARLSELGGGSGIIDAAADRLESERDAELAAAMRRCARALDDPAVGEVRGGAERRLLGYVYPVV